MRRYLVLLDEYAENDGVEVGGEQINVEERGAGHTNDTWQDGIDREHEKAVQTKQKPLLNDD